MRQSRLHRVASVLVGWRALAAGFMIGVAIAVVAVARGGDTGESGGGPGGAAYLVAALLAAIAFIVVLNVVFQLAGVDPTAPEIAERLAAGSDQQRLLTRWLERARWARFVGGLAGIVAWALGTRTEGSIFVWGFGGIAVGALVAELHHLRRPSGPRTARLEVRRVRNYLWPFAAWNMVAAAAGGTVVAVLGLAAGERSAFGHGLGAVATIGVGHLAQRRVASRPRPALPDTLRSADDLARELAIDRGIAWPCSYAAFSLIAMGSAAFDGRFGAVALLGIVAQFWAIGLWWRNRRLGLDHLVREQGAPVLA